LNQTELAKATGMSEATISKILSGRRYPSWRVAKLLAKATNSDAKIWMDDDLKAKKTAMEGGEE